MDYRSKIKKNAFILIISISVLISSIYSILYYTDIRDILLKNLIDKSQIFSEYVTKTIYTTYQDLYKYGSNQDKLAFEELISLYINRRDINLGSIIITDVRGNVLYDSNPYSREEQLNKEHIYSSLKIEYLDKSTLNVRKVKIQDNDFLQINSPYIDSNGEQTHFIIFLYNLNPYMDKTKTSFLMIVLLIMGSLILSIILSIIYGKSSDTVLTQLITERDLYKPESFLDEDDFIKLYKQEKKLKYEKSKTDEILYDSIDNTDFTNAKINYLIKKASEYFKDNKIQEALKIYHMLFNEFPNNPKILNNIGVIYLKKDNPQRALRYFKIVSKLNPDFKGIKDKIKLAQSLIKNS